MSRGRCRLASTLPGVIACSLSAPALGAQSVAGGVSVTAQVIGTLQPTDSVVGQLAGNGEQVYLVSLRQGQYVDVALEHVAAGKPVGFRVFAPDSTWVGAAASWEREAGPPMYTLLAPAAGTYRISLDGAPAARYGLRLRAHGNEEAARESQGLAAAKAWLARSGHTLRRLEAGGDHSDLLPLRDILRGVRVVALGEATHGTREFEQVKHRMLEFLVTRMGYTHFGLEASEEVGAAINQFVLTGEGDRAALLARLAQWHWDAEEIAATVDWMRDHNRSVPAPRRVQFFGFDFQINPFARSEITSYLRRVAPERVSATDSLLAVLTEPVDSLRRDYLRLYALAPDARRPMAASINELRGFLEVNRAHFTAGTSPAEFDDVVRAVERLQQLADAHTRPGYAIDTASTGLATRDRHMAENVQRLLDRLPAGSKLVLSMHNEHARSDPHLYTTGHYLRAALGDAYYAFHLGFDSGSFRALDLSTRPYKVRPLTIGPAFPLSLDWAMREAGRGDMYVDFRRAPTTGPAAGWLRRPRRVRSIGGGHPPMNAGYYRDPAVAGVSFDGLLFIRRSTPIRLNPTVTR